MAVTRGWALGQYQVSRSHALSPVRRHSMLTRPRTPSRVRNDPCAFRDTLCCIVYPCLQRFCAGLKRDTGDQGAVSSPNLESAAIFPHRFNSGCIRSAESHFQPTVGSSQPLRCVSRVHTSCICYLPVLASYNQMIRKGIAMLYTVKCSVDWPVSL